MATITQTWSNALLSNSSIGDTIDDKVNQLATAVQERLKNGGHQFASSSAATSGIHAVSTDNYTASEWDVYESDLVTKALRILDTGVLIGRDLDVGGDVTVTGSLTVGGNPVGGDHYTLVASLPVAVVGVLHVTVPASGTIERIDVDTSFATAGSTATIRIKQYSSPTWSSDEISSKGSGSTLKTFSISTSRWGARSTGRSDAILASDLLEVTVTGGNLTTNEATVTVTFYILKT